MIERREMNGQTALLLAGRLVGYLQERGPGVALCSPLGKEQRRYDNVETAIEALMKEYNTEIRHYRHGEGDFWQQMGPFFASMEVQRELGLPMRSDESFQWWIAFVEGKVVGFCAAEEQKNGVVLLRHAWITPAHREQGIYRALFERRQRDLEEQGHTHFRTTTSGRALTHILKQGFEKTRERGQYSILEKEVQQ